MSDEVMKVQEEKKNLCYKIYLVKQNFGIEQDDKNWKC
jgi:hypothetical protein